MPKFPKIWVTVGLLLACAAVPYAVPGLSGYRALDPSRLFAVLTAPWRGNPFEKVFRARGDDLRSKPPAADNVWMPGVWTWRDTRYLWRPGYWSVGHPNWVWSGGRVGLTTHAISEIGA